MAAYAATAGLEPFIINPPENIAFGKLSQALDYGARTVRVEANFDQILPPVRILAERFGIYLSNSVNPFRIEGQESIVIEMLDQLDWIVFPGGNLGNLSALGHALRELLDFGLIDKLPHVAVVQAAGSAPFYDYVRQDDKSAFPTVKKPDALPRPSKSVTPSVTLKP